VTALAGRAGVPMPPRLTALDASLRAGFHSQFFDGQAGVYGDGSVTASLLPLAFDLVPADWRGHVAAQLIDQIERVHDGHVCFGLIGCQWINRMLTRLGRADLALRMAVRPDVPGLGAMIARGATTLWELWDGPDADPAMSSDNHTMLMGDLLTWLFSDLAGIQPCDDAPGFARFTLAPTLVPGLDWLNATHDSVRGLISSFWRVEGRVVHFAFTVPPGSVAMIVLPPDLTIQRPDAWSERGLGRYDAPPGKYEIEAHQRWPARGSVMGSRAEMTINR
jgi:alpha-L-rhamnosidase